MRLFVWDIDLEGFGRPTDIIAVLADSVEEAREMAVGLWLDAAGDAIGDHIDDMSGPEMQQLEADYATVLQAVQRPPKGDGGVYIALC